VLLPGHQQRVEDATTVVDGDVAQQLFPGASWATNPAALIRAAQPPPGASLILRRVVFATAWLDRA